MGAEGRIVQRYVLVVPPQVRRVEVVGVSLAVVAEEQVESLLVRIARTARRSESPFAHRSRRVPGGLQRFGQRHRLVRNRLLAFRPRLGLPVVANVRMPQVLARHQHAPRRGTHRCTAIELREPDPFRRHLIQVGRADLLLAVTAQLAVAQIIGQEEHDVRFVGALAAIVGGRSRSRRRPEARQQKRPPGGLTFESLFRFSLRCGWRYARSEFGQRVLQAGRQNLTKTRVGLPKNVATRHGRIQFHSQFRTCAIRDLERSRLVSFRRRTRFPPGVPPRHRTGNRHPTDGPCVQIPLATSVPSRRAPSGRRWGWSKRCSQSACLRPLPTPAHGNRVGRPASIRASRPDRHRAQESRRGRPVGGFG